MIPERLISGERAIRRAVARKQYGDLPRRIEDLRRIADEHILALSAGDPRRKEIAGWMLAKMRWIRLVVTTQRQIWSDELDRLPHVGRYLDRPDHQLPFVCVDL